jgi:hypothetical protein
MKDGRLSSTDLGSPYRNMPASQLGQIGLQYAAIGANYSGLKFEVPESSPQQPGQLISHITALWLHIEVLFAVSRSNAYSAIREYAPTMLRRRRLMPKVLISGASIAGPTLAYWLLKGGFDVTVVERAAAPRAGGQAIDVRGPALSVVKEMGLLDQAMSMRTHMKGMSNLDIDGREISRTEERTISGGRFNSGDIEILRDDLAGLLLDATRPAASYVYDDTIVAWNRMATA